MDSDQTPLPRLTGKPKQIAWAESIRARFIEAMDTHERESEAHLALRSVGYRALVQLQLDRQRRVFALIRSHVAASWWIENQTKGLAMLTAAEHRATKALVIRYEPRSTPPLH